MNICAKFQLSSWSRSGWKVSGGGGVVCTVIFMSNPTVVLCCVGVGVLTKFYYPILTRPIPVRRFGTGDKSVHVWDFNNYQFHFMSGENIWWPDSPPVKKSVSQPTNPTSTSTKIQTQIFFKISYSKKCFPLDLNGMSGCATQGGGGYVQGRCLHPFITWAMWWVSSENSLKMFSQDN